jgi:sulfite exporter TauE/SafE
MLLWSALIMGLIGNFHCLGMCGPIALAIPVKREGKYAKATSILLYNFGRILMYALIGLLFGLFGTGIVLFGFQQHLSIILGVLIVLAVLVPFLFKKLSNGKGYIFTLISKLKSTFAQQFKKNSYPAIFTLGLLNGLLPCGLVYVAVAGATATGSWYYGMAYMALFGLGTLPVMAALPYFGAKLSPNLKKKFTKLILPTMLLFGMLLILRGSNLGIPYVSPQMSNDTEISEQNDTTNTTRKSTPAIPKCH